MGTIIINPYAVSAAGVSAPSGVVIDNPTDGTDNSIDLYNLAPTNKVTNGDPPIMVVGPLASTTLTIRANGVATGSVSTWAWSTTLTDPTGIFASQSNTTGSSQNYTNSVLTFAGSFAGSGSSATLTVDLAATNSGGTGNATQFSCVFFVP